MRSIELWLVMVITLVNIINVLPGDVASKLQYYEFLHMSDIERRTRRDTGPNPATHLHQFWFKAFDRKFHLVLKQSNIIPKNFKARTVNNKQKSEFSIPNSDFLQGYLSDDENSHVEAHWEAGVLSASITTADDIIVLEPSWRFLKSSAQENKGSMIIYKKSDLISEPQDKPAGYKVKFCGNDAEVSRAADEIPSDNEDTFLENFYKDYKHRRLKREQDFLGSRKVCRLFVVADYEFHKNVGGNNKHTTARYMIGIMSRVNQIFMQTKWPDDSSDIEGLGFEIAELEIHENYTHQGVHYNNPNRQWNTTFLLQVFSRGTAFKDYCLAHLFTYHRFSRGVLGLAYIAGREKSQPGGICSTGPSPGKVYEVNGHQTTFNTGWSTAQNSEGDRVLSLEAALVIAHELGHNWGSEHDPDTASCAPGVEQGGKYLMYQYSVSGYEHNNQIFSSCSKRYIYNVIKTKGPGCFTESNSLTVCGNGRIEGDEECDAGFNGDSCCTSFCKLQSGALCSPMNHECCDNKCRTADNNTICHALPDSLVTCKGISKCNGVNLTCPEAGNKEDDSPCVDGGLCKNGVCLNYCVLRDKVPCICSKESGYACYRCCKVRNESECLPEPPPPALSQKLPNGRPCFHGVCVEGVCEKQKNHIVQRLFSIIDTITVDQFVEFMKTNIVGTILVFSLLLWIPASCTFSYFDKKRERRLRMRHGRWKSHSRFTLLMDYLDSEDRQRIKQAGSFRVKHFGGSVIRHPIMRSGHIHLTQSNFTKDVLQYPDDLKESSV
uniref:ADAM 17-like protease isoform X1 n=1 Tax=Crassostrea virginica TaxID=6565 RepID=A0A8B8D387_CRAVI|nr:ADAM 17-like protease isoform X1 [Crassostrea virginica]